ncbi:22128_t:CDS:1 [Rhizophagus irregularis]|nr:22128_t:CDS:1 [Rhizophagus irregularis]
MARTYKKAVTEANAEVFLERSDNTKTNEGDKTLNRSIWSRL